MKLQREYCVENHFEVGPCGEDGYYDQYGKNSYSPVHKERSDYYEKIFKDGLLIYEINNTEYIENGTIITTRIIRYDKNSRIIKEFISKLESVQGYYGEDNRFEINYEYNGESYRKIIKRTYKGSQEIDQNDSRLTMFYKEIDQIDSILEVKILNGKKLFEKYVSFIDGTNRETKYIYGEDTGLLFEIDGYHEVDGQICSNSKYAYELPDYKLSKETHFNQKGDICLQKIFRKGNLIEKTDGFFNYFLNPPLLISVKTAYEDGLVKEENYIYEGYTNSDFASRDSKIIFYYDDRKNLIKEEYYKKNTDLPYKMKLFMYESIEVNNEERQVNSKIFTKNERKSINESLELITPLTNENTENFIVTEQIEKTYNSQGNLHQVKNYNQDTLYELITYSYNSEGNKIIETIFQSNAEDPPHKAINLMEEYDTEGNITKKATLEIFDSRIQKESIINYSYEFDQPAQQGSNHYFSVRNDHCHFPKGFQPLKL